MARRTEAEASPVADFEASLDALERLVEDMERGEMGLEQSLAAYERGVGLYRRCQAALEQAELRVKLLSDPVDPASAETFQQESRSDAQSGRDPDNHDPDSRDLTNRDLTKRDPNPTDA